MTTNWKAFHADRSVGRIARLHEAIEIQVRNRALACPNHCGNYKQYADDDECGWCQHERDTEQDSGIPRSRRRRWNERR
jgi:hypothetical protein